MILSSYTHIQDTANQDCGQNNWGDMFVYVCVCGGGRGAGGEGAKQLRVKNRGKTTRSKMTRGKRLGGKMSYLYIN